MCSMLPSVCSVRSLEQLAGVEVLLLLLFNTAPVVYILIVEIVISDSSYLFVFTC